MIPICTVYAKSLKQIIQTIGSYILSYNIVH